MAATLVAAVTVVRAAGAVLRVWRRASSAWESTVLMVMAVMVVRAVWPVAAPTAATAIAVLTRRVDPVPRPRRAPMVAPAVTVVPVGPVVRPVWPVV